MQDTMLTRATAAQRSRYFALLEKLLGGAANDELDGYIDEHAALCAEIDPGIEQQRARAQAAINGPRAQGDDVIELDVYDIVGGGWFYGGITAQAVRDRLKRSPNAKTIRLRMNSEGGEVFEGVAIYNLLNEHPARVEVTIDALCASIATIIACAGDEIRMADSAWFMIHNPWVRMGGESKDLRRQADVLDGMAEQFAAIYHARTGLSVEQLREKMDAETWMKASEAKALGFVDVVQPAKKAKAAAQAFACMSVDDFSKVPAELREQLEAARKPEGDGEGAPAAATPSATEEPAAPAQEQLDLSPAPPAENATNPPAPAAPPPSAAAENKGATMADKKDSPEILALLAALGLDSQAELTSKILLLNKIEAITGKAGDAAYGVLLAWQETAANSAKTVAELAALKAEKEGDDIEKAFADAKAAKKVYPNLEAQLRKQYEEKNITAEGLKSTLEALAPNHALAADPKAAAAGNGGNSGSEQLRYQGKTYAEMSGVERDRLHKADVELFATMRKQALEAGLI